jgi:hypothetical protein
MESAFYFVLSEEVRHISSERINYFSSSYFNARVSVCKVSKECGVIAKGLRSAQQVSSSSQDVHLL